MAVSASELNQIFASTPLGGREIIRLGVLDTPEEAYIIATSLKSLEGDWRIARSQLASIRRWPLAVTSWGSSNPVEEDFFSRFYFQEETSQADVSPREIIKRSLSISPETALENLVQADDCWPLEEVIEYELEAAQLQFGRRPSESDVRALMQERESNRFELDRLLLHWELERGLHWNPEDARQEWYEQEPSYLVFLPVSSAWESLAYIHWYGCLRFTTEEAIVLGRSWERRYGAELWAHYGTMLQCFVSKPPQDIDAAWALAREHYLAAPYTTIAPGISLRQYAVGLLNHGNWFLHERP